MSLIEEIESRLKAKTIHDLRQIGRAVGVPRPAEGKKERLLDCILKIASGESDPALPSVRGAHPKSAEYDRALVSDILRCREVSLFSGEQSEGQTAEISVGSGQTCDALDFTDSGILEKVDGKWFMRGKCDIAVNEYFINNYGLREGDCVTGKCKRSSLEENAGLVAIASVNGLLPESISNRADFEKLTPIYPDKRLRVASGADDITGRIIDYLCPVGAGQRALICAPHGAGKTALLKDIGCGLRKNNPETKFIVLLIDARPEEAADFARAFAGADVFTSPIGAGANGHINTAKLALEYAKRQVELSYDVVLILDDLTRLTRAYNSAGRQLTNTLDANAIDCAKKFMAMAKNTEEGASLTIISAVSTVGDIVDEAIYSGLKDVCNMRVSLSLQLARMRIYPPVDVAETFTSGDERLLTPNELKTAASLRKYGIEEIIDKITEID